MHQHNRITDIMLRLDNSHKKQPAVIADSKFGEKLLS